jgi:UDP-N-acetylglucosamine--N-acetylmuramyl-(pentapeptide) pyrophosphoryl-undecaprenol N-acetylglucosamine transferase
MRVLIAVGGGGHFSPALAVLDEMPKEWGILLVGRQHAFEADKTLSLEFQTAQRLHLPFVAIKTGRLQRKVSPQSITSLLKMPLGFAQASRIVHRFKPDVVLSFGGYIAVPVVLAAKLQRIPIVIHEQTLHAGLANQISAKFADTICLSWETSQKYFPKEKSVITGNPLRKEFLTYAASNMQQKQSDDEKLLYITGGSAGAHGINVLIEGCLEKLLEHYTVIHQTGDAQQFCDYERLEKRRTKLPEKLQKKYILNKFISTEQVVQIVSQADLVIARSGINTVTELLYLGKPSLFIPLPYGQRNEQLSNAQFVERLGMAKIIEQANTSSNDLLQTIHTMIKNSATYLNNAAKARSLVHSYAAQRILSILSVYEKEKQHIAS